MKTPCKTCKNLVHTDFEPTKSCSRYDENGDQDFGHNDKWICACCKDEVCVNCYIKHNSKAHPELYSAKCLGCQKLTFAEDFREYGICKDCSKKGKEANT